MVAGLVVGPPVSETRATPAPDFFVCAGGAVFDDAADSPENVITPGADGVIIVGIEFQRWTAGSRPPEFDDRCVRLTVGLGFTGFEAVLRLIDPAAPLIALDWTVLDSSLVAGATVPAAPAAVTWTINLDRTLRSAAISDFQSGEGTAYAPPPGGLEEAETLSSAIFVSVSEGLSPGSYRLDIEFIFETAPGVVETFPALVPFEVVAVASSAPASPAASVSCGEPTAGAVVTCTLTAEPEFDLLWEASTNPVFAGGVVTTDASGTGEFSFTVPAGAVGQEVSVRIVDWTAAVSIGVARMPVPIAVHAGESGGAPVGMAVMLMVGAMALLGRMARAGHTPGR